jgi:hypothetical protein
LPLGYFVGTHWTGTASDYACDLSRVVAAEGLSGLVVSWDRPALGHGCGTAA